jgi:hypothetical protein
MIELFLGLSIHVARVLDVPSVGTATRTKINIQSVIVWTIIESTFISFAVIVDTKISCERRMIDEKSHTLYYLGSLVSSLGFLRCSAESL